MNKHMIVFLLAVAVWATMLPGADIPFAEREPDKFPSQSLVGFALHEVHGGFIHPKPGRDNWTLFIPLLERVAKRAAKDLFGANKAMMTTPCGSGRRRQASSDC